MYNIGVVPGKFFPPHRGHLFQILRAATQCKTTYVVVSDNEDLALNKCRKDNLPFIPLKTRALWLSRELQDIENIKVVILDETDMPAYPDGSVMWCAALQKLIPNIDIIYGGEKEYANTYMKHMPDIEYGLFEYRRGRYPCSGTEIRANYLKYWDYILGSARPFFARRVLITGTESCAKSTLTRILAKIYHTSWSEEYGRFYSRDHLGGNEELFEAKDFAKVASIQQDQDEQKALRSANRICFFDSDAVVTQYYCDLYMGAPNPFVETFVDPQKYDVVLFMAPTVGWIADGLRFKSDQKERERLHNKLLYMYYDRGFKDKIIEIDYDNYSARLAKAMNIADQLLADRMWMSRY